MVRMKSKEPAPGEGGEPVLEQDEADRLRQELAAEQQRRGWRLGDKVLRPAQVAVAAPLQDGR